MTANPTKPIIGHDVSAAVDCLNSGQLIGLPTETVYGLGADATNQKAIERVFKAKGRPADHPLIVHLFSVYQLPEWANDIPDSAYQLAKAFWPGPMTLILNRGDNVLDAVTGGQNTVGLRIPSHPKAQSLLKQFGKGVVAPSANRFGRISPTQPQHVVAELGDAVSYILDGGNCAIGLESTIINLSGKQPEVLRLGHITVEQIETVLDCPVNQPAQSPDKALIKVPGSLESHYSPVTPALLRSTDWLHVRLNASPAGLSEVGLIAHSLTILQSTAVAHVGQSIMASDNPPYYAKDVYKNLRQLDENPKVKEIWVEAVPKQKDWAAVADRLSRACH